MSLGGGDQLAKGARSHVFPSNSHISDEKWNAIWAEEKPVESKPAKKKKSKPSAK